MANKIIDMCCHFVGNLGKMKPIEQRGESTYYRKFTQDDDVLDVNISIKDAFSRFRVADFERFPLYFDYESHRYSIVIRRIS